MHFFGQTGCHLATPSTKWVPTDSLEPTKTPWHTSKKRWTGRQSSFAARTRMSGDTTTIPASSGNNQSRCCFFVWRTKLEQGHLHAHHATINVNIAWTVSFMETLAVALQLMLHLVRHLDLLICLFQDRYGVVFDQRRLWHDRHLPWCEPRALHRDWLFVSSGRTLPGKVETCSDFDHWESFFQVMVCLG